PLGLFELKRPGKRYAHVEGAFRQTQTYRSQIPELFKWNQVTAVSDGLDTRAGSFSAPGGPGAAWKTIDGADRAPRTADAKPIPSIEVLVRGMFRPDVFF